MTQFPGINALLGQAASAKELSDGGAGVVFVLLNRTYPELKPVPLPG